MSGTRCVGTVRCHTCAQSDAERVGGEESWCVGPAVLISRAAVPVGGCVRVCALLPFVLFGTFNPPGHISELKNFRADRAF